MNILKKIIKTFIIIVIVLLVVYVGIQVIYNLITGGVDCCSCCDDNAEYCISACCECNYNIIEKIEVIFNKK